MKYVAQYLPVEQYRQAVVNLAKIIIDGMLEDMSDADGIRIEVGKFRGDDE